MNKQVLFRRALKLINGGINGGVNNLPDTGLTVAAENGIYVQGNYNATTPTWSADTRSPGGDHRRRDHDSVEQLERRELVEQPERHGGARRNQYRVSLRA